MMVQNCKIGAQNFYVAISGCLSLSQSHGDSLFKLGVVEDPRFAAEISIISVSLSEI